MTDESQSGYVQTRDDLPDPSGWVGRVRKWVRDGALELVSRLSVIANGDGSADQLRCLHFHGVFDDQRTEFRELMASLDARATFIDTETCLRMVRGERPIDGMYLHLSFDDGFRNNVENAAPILDDLEIPAIFFVTTDYVSSGWDGAVEFAERSGRNGIVEIATWEDLTRLKRRGFQIGAHTRTHPRLSELSAGEIEQEVVGSKRAIEDHLGVECRYFAWPFGGLSDVRPVVIETVRRAGFEGCFSGSRGEVDPGRTDPFRIPRHSIQPHWPISHVHYFAFRGKIGTKLSGALQV